MRLIVDPDRCESNGLCAETAPDIFELDEADVLHVHIAHLEPGQWPAVELAARACPKLAITLLSDA